MKHLLATCLGLTLVVTADAQQKLVTLDAGPTQMSLSRDGRYFAVIATDGAKEKRNVLRIWDTRTGDRVGPVDDAFDGTWRFAFSPTEDVLVAAYRRQVYEAGLSAFELPAWKQIHETEFDELKGRLNAITFGGDGKWIVRLMDHKKVTFFDTLTGKEIRRGEVDIDPRFGFGPDHLYVSPDGKYLATYTFNNGSEVWDTTTLKRVVQYPAILDLHNDGRIRSNGQSFEDMALVPGKEQVLIRDRNGLSQFTFDSQEPVKVFKVSARRIGGFLEEGRICVVRDEFIDLETGKKTTMLPWMLGEIGPKHRARETCLSADGSTLAALYYTDLNQLKCNIHLFDATQLVADWKAKQQGKPGRQRPANPNTKPNTKPADKPKPQANDQSKPKPTDKPQTAGGKVGGKTMPQWFGQLQDGEWEKRKQAMEALAKFGKKPVPKLIEQLQGDNVARRRRAAQALKVIGPIAKDAVPTLKKALDDTDERVRKYAGEALLAIQREN